MTGFKEIQSHGVAHIADTDESKFHVVLLLILYICGLLIA
jgi:hypothetical protein